MFRAYRCLGCSRIFLTEERPITRALAEEWEEKILPPTEASPETLIQVSDLSLEGIKMPSLTPSSEQMRLDLE